MLDSWIEKFELFAMFFVVGVMAANFGPKSVGMIHMVEVGKFVDNDIVTKWLGDLHEANIERNGAIAAATAPTGGGMTEATFVVGVAVKFSVIFQSIGQVFASFFHEDFFLGITSTLGVGVTKGDFFVNELTVDIQKPFN